MAGVFTAQMSMRKGRWRLYVVLMNTTEQWPEYRFGPTVPTFTDRVNALTALGFAPLPDATWEWTEDTETHDDPSSPVILIAVIGVRSWTGAGA